MQPKDSVSMNLSGEVHPIVLPFESTSGHVTENIERRDASRWSLEAVITMKMIFFFKESSAVSCGMHDLMTDASPTEHTFQLWWKLLAYC